MPFNSQIFGTETSQNRPQIVKFMDTDLTIWGPQIAKFADTTHQELPGACRHCTEQESRFLVMDPRLVSLYILRNGIL